MLTVDNRWLFEKYDGVRAFWNPTAKAFYSRGGDTFQIPQEIIDKMPSDIFLDGELWWVFPLYFPLSLSPPPLTRCENDTPLLGLAETVLRRP